MSFAFVFSFFDDETLAKRLIRQLRQFYPNTDILCQADGVNPPDFSEYAQINTVTYVEGGRLKPRTFGGQWTQRYLNLFLQQSTADVLIKVDPDSYIHRAFTDLPESLQADLFGNLKTNHLGQVQVRGGCVGYQRAAVQKLVESNLLLEAKYRDATRYSYRRKPDDPLLSLQDAIMADVAQQLQLQLHPWPEVRIYAGNEAPPANPGLQFAITHPMKS
jgi:hypothetical protein